MSFNSSLGAVGSRNDLGGYKLGQLAQIHNELRQACGGDPVSRFSDRAAAVRRTSEALEEWQSQQPQKATKRSIAPPPPPQPTVASPVIRHAAVGRPAGPRRLSIPPSGEVPGVHKPNSIRGKLIGLCSREGGATMEEMRTAASRTEVQVRSALRQIAAFLGHGVEEKEGKFLILGTPQRRHLSCMAASDTQKAHRSGTKREKMLNLMRLPAGATVADMQAATGWNEEQTREAVRIINSYLGWGIIEELSGRMHAFLSTEKVALFDRLGLSEAVAA